MKATTGTTIDNRHSASVILNEGDCIAILYKLAESSVRTDLLHALREARDKASQANLAMQKETNLKSLTLY